MGDAPKRSCPEKRGIKTQGLSFTQALCFFHRNPHRGEGVLSAPYQKRDILRTVLLWVRENRTAG